MIKEVVDSLAANIKERISSPFLGVYSVVLVAHLWKPLVILFTSASQGQILVDEVSKTIPELWDLLAHPFWYALGFSIAYPMLRALLAQIAVVPRRIEITVESRLEEQKEALIEQRARRKVKEVDEVIDSLEGLVKNQQIRMKDIERISRILPSKEEVLDHEILRNAPTWSRKEA